MRNETTEPDLFTTLAAITKPEPHYFNTTRETEPKLSEYRAKAAHQDNAVLDVIDRLGGSAGPSQVWVAMGRKCPITSVRRACTNLTNAGKLVKTDRKQQGEWGRSEFVWQLVQV